MDSTLATLTDQIAQVHDRAQVAAVQQVNYWLTARNWVVGWYLAEYEQQGSDRATYGDRLLGELARALPARGVRGLGLTNLKLCRQFYQTYPALLAHEAATWQQLGVSLPTGAIGQTLSDQLPLPNALPGLAPTLLLSRLSFSHFIKLLKLDRPLQRASYEVQAQLSRPAIRAAGAVIHYILFSELRQHCEALCKFGDSPAAMRKIARAM
jgi:hypothetical protein